ncbi:MAG: L-2-amino-thiazoline-4-carboxylic acid hydrolase [Treponema sp.]|jgi:hypothetical protein|nr:L-2-amino-thiazoline-4-carboxylic acid hydrolase [Treponema sp.]
MGIVNTAKKNGFLVRNLRNFFEHRALWMYFLCDEARKAGAKPEQFAPAAIRRCGLFLGGRAITGIDSQAGLQAESERRGESCKLLKKKLFPRAGQKIFEMKILRLTDDNFDVDFHYCPLVAAWKKQGCTDEECDKMCDWAMEGDRGIAEAFGCELDLPKTIAKGDGVCQIRFRRKN